MSIATQLPAAPAGDARQIGAWRVEPELNRISTGAATRKLEPKAMSVLMVLADRCGQVVSRDALLAAAWPGVIVGDDSLTQVVIKLRKALGDASDAPTYIQTIAKGGYRLIAQVSSVAPAVAGLTSPGVQQAGTQRRRHPAWVPVAGIFVALLAMAVLWRFDRLREIDAMPLQALPSNLESSRAVEPGLAVVPFEALGDDPQAVLLAQGMTADLLTDLSKVAALSVIATKLPRTEKIDASAAEVAPVRYLVSGSVQRVDDRLRLQVHLADASSGEQLWSERFDRPLAGFFAIQQELGTRILQMLPAKVSEAELRRVAQRYTQNLEAYQYFQRGQASLLVRDHADNETARAMFRDAIALDPQFARAYAGIALTYAADYRNRWSADGGAALDRAFEMARTAYQIDPDGAETYWVLAFVNVERRRHAQAIQHLTAAVRLFPSFADGYALMGGVYTYIGRPADTVPLMRTAMRLDPQAGYLYFLLLGRAYFFLGDFEQARVNLQYALSRNPASLESHVYMAAVSVAAGDRTSAAWEAEEIRALQPDFVVRKWLDAYPMTDIGQKTTLARTMGALGF